MNETENRDRSGSHYSNKGHEEIDASLMSVRNALLSLPKVTAPAGFEYRLNRRLQGLDEQPRAAARSWASGWLGVGLGFACAAVIALFALDFDAGSPTTTPMTEKNEQVAPTQPVIQTDAATPEVLPVATTDSVPRDADPTRVSSDKLHQASTNQAERPR